MTWIFHLMSGKCPTVHFNITPLGGEVALCAPVMSVLCRKFRMSLAMRVKTQRILDQKVQPASNIFLCLNLSNFRALCLIGTCRNAALRCIPVQIWSFWDHFLTVHHMFLIDLLNLWWFKIGLYLWVLYLDLGNAKYQLTYWLDMGSTSSMVLSIMGPLTSLSMTRVALSERAGLCRVILCTGCFSIKVGFWSALATLRTNLFASNSL